MESLLPKIINGININMNRRQIIYFKSSISEMTPGIVKDLSRDLVCQIDVCDTWEGIMVRFGILSHMAPDLPVLLLVDAEMISTNDTPVREIISMISTFGRCVKKKEKIKLGVVLEKPCSASFIKELQSTDILGIVPRASIFGYNSTLASLEQLFNGHSHWPREAINSVTNCSKSKVKSSNSPGDKLTPRQKQVLDLVCNRGLSNKKIASSLNITESTVKIHVSAILKEYGVRNRTQLALAASSSLKA